MSVSEFLSEFVFMSLTNSHTMRRNSFFTFLTMLRNSFFTFLFYFFGDLIMAWYFPWLILQVTYSLDEKVHVKRTFVALKLKWIFVILEWLELLKIRFVVENYF